MERLKEHVKLLLHEYECIIIPGFGALVSARQSSVLNEDEQLIYPPSKKIAFNPELHNNDALLIHTWTKQYKISFDEAANEIHKEVNDWIDHLKSGNELLIDKVGVFKMDSGNKIIFKASGNYNFLLDSYGMSETIAKPVVYQTVADNKIKKLASVTVKNEVAEETKEKTSGFKFTKYAATIIILMVFGLALYFLPDNSVNLNLGSLSPFKNSLPVDISPSVVSKTEITKEITTEYEAVRPEKENSEVTHTETIQTEVNISEPTQNFNFKYYIIGGSFSQKENAQRFKDQLRNKGFSSEILETNIGMYRVSYKNFQTETEAEKDLKRIKTEENPAAWILEENN